MKIIADPETGGLYTIALAIDWGLPQNCQVEGCKEKTFAILNFTDGEIEGRKAIQIAICKKHYEEGIKTGVVKWRFIL
ncbi:hypothetical protein KAW18_02965 [candidate division WOR-3 bacterium]|nr:hypothetical protein [candidate division WOR-3 bacterium]